MVSTSSLKLSIPPSAVTAILFLSMLPVVRIPAEVHFGKNEYPVRFYTIEDTVGEAIWPH